MEYIKGYKFNTEEEALQAIDKCNQHYGISQSPDNITQNWCYYHIAELNNPVFYYIKSHESLVSVLGYDTMIEILTPEKETTGYVGS